MSNLAAQGIPFLLLLVVTPVLLTSLGRERYGALILFNLIPQIAGQLDLGFATAATRGFAQYSARGERDAALRLFREVLVLLTVWGAVLAVVFYLCRATIAHALNLDTIVDDDSWIYLSAAIAIPVALANAATLVPLRATERYGRVARIQVGVGMVYWTACAVWAPRGGTLTQLVALGTLTVAAGTVALYRAAHDGPRPSADDATVDPALPAPLVALPDATIIRLPTAAPASRPASRFLLRPFLPLSAGAFVAQASSLATYHADKLLVSALISPAAVGAYAICTNIANKILLVVAAGTTFTFPRSAKLHAEGNLAAVAATFADTTRIAMLAATAIAVSVAALAPAFLEVWIGATFAHDFGDTLRLLAIGYTISAASVVASNVAFGIGEVRIPASFAILGGVVTLVSVGILAPRYGAAGAAGAAVIGMSQAAIFNSVVARRLGPDARAASWPLLWRLALVAVPVALLSAATTPLVGGWFSLLATGALTSGIFVALWVLLFADGDERAMLRRLASRLTSRPAR